MTVNEAFKLRLEQYLFQRQISLYKFAKDGCIPRSTLTSIMRGYAKSATLATLYQVTNALGITVLEFLDCDLFKEENIDF